MEIGTQQIVWHSMDEKPSITKYSVDVLVKVTGCSETPQVLCMQFCENTVKGKEVYRYKYLNTLIPSSWSLQAWAYMPDISNETFDDEKWSSNRTPRPCGKCNRCGSHVFYKDKNHICEVCGKIEKSDYEPCYYPS